jgi:hypothetical protein
MIFNTLLYLILILNFSASQSQIKPSQINPAQQTKTSMTTIEKPIMLVGHPNDLAINVIKNFSSAIKTRSDQPQKTKVILGVKTGTTVAQVNALIRSINGSLVRTFEKSPILEIIIPNSSQIGWADLLLKRLRSQPFVDFAMMQCDPPRI